MVRICGDVLYNRMLPAGMEAKELRLVSQAYPSQEALMAGATAMARAIAAKSPLAVCGTKRVLLYQRRAVEFARAVARSPAEHRVWQAVAVLCLAP